MTQKDKELLFKDLSARLPYGVKTIYKDRKDIIMNVVIVSTALNEMCMLEWDSCKGYYNQTHAHVGDFKPYLRPMSNMTEEERKEYNEYLFHGASIGLMSNTESAYELIDWLNAHYFDYRGLIEKGLAIEAPEKMYN